MNGAFTAADWAVVFAYLALTTWLGIRLSGKQQTIRDYFLGGRQLPWLAVCGSIVASEVSGVTFVSVPAIAWATDGNYTYLMLAVGSILGRIIIGYWFIPAFYEKEIYSPYEFMGQRLGPIVDRVATVLFLLGGLLAQGSRLFLAGLVLDAITGMGIPAAVVTVAAVSVVWTWFGGITSVVWTDVMQFVILFIGGLVALGAAISAVPGGLEEVLRVGKAADKFVLWNFSWKPTDEFTFWCGLFGTTFLTLGSHGTDQMMAQRLFCCRDPREARKAVIASSVGILLAAIMLSVGVAIYAYFLVHPMSAADAARVTERKDYLFPVFILQSMPVGIRGLLFAAIFAAATATSTLAAMAQTGLSSLVRPLMRRELTEREMLWWSRGLVVVAAVGLSVVAILCSQMTQYKDVLRLALTMAAYSYGAMLGMFLLALLPLKRDALGLIWSVPYSILTVLAFSWQQVEAVRYVIGALAGLLVLAGLVRFVRDPLRLVGVLAGAAIVLFVAFFVHGHDARPLKLAFPWMFPIGCAITLGFGGWLGRPRVVTSTT